MAKATASLASQCYLEPMNLHDSDQFSEIQRQRIICGWDFDPETLQKWKYKQDEGLRSFFWISVPNTSTSTSIENNNNKSVPAWPIRAGHISLSAYCDPLRPSFTSTDKSEFAVQMFFLLPDYRSYRLGQRAMGLVEELAVKEPYGSPNCRFITLTALSKRYFYDDGPEWGGIWERLGISPPSFSIQEWYEKLGYVAWKEEPLYKEKALDGQVIKLIEAFMRKEVQPKSAVISELS